MYQGLPFEYPCSLYHIDVRRTGGAALVANQQFFTVGTAAGKPFTNLSTANKSPWPVTIYAIVFEVHAQNVEVAIENIAIVQFATALLCGSAVEVKLDSKWTIIERLTNLPQGGGGPQLHGSVAFDGAAAPTTVRHLTISNGQAVTGNAFFCPMGIPIRQDGNIEAQLSIEAATLAEVNAQIAALGTEGVWFGFRLRGARMDAEAQQILAERCKDERDIADMMNKMQGPQQATA